MTKKFSPNNYKSFIIHSLHSPYTCPRRRHFPRPSWHCRWPSVDCALSCMAYHRQRTHGAGQNTSDSLVDSWAHTRHRLGRIESENENQEIEKLSHMTEQLLCVQWFNPPFTYGSHLYFCPRNDWLSNSRHCSARKSPSLFGHSWKMRAEHSTLWDEWHPINYRQKLKLQFSMLIFHFVRENTTTAPYAPLCARSTLTIFWQMWNLLKNPIHSLSAIFVMLIRLPCLYLQLIGKERMGRKLKV